MGIEIQFFFYKVAIERRRRNVEEKLVYNDGSVCDNFDSLLSLASRYFESLFSSNGISNVDLILERVQPCITESMNEELSIPFTLKEVRLALKSMSPLKASGKDSLRAVFY